MGNGMNKVLPGLYVGNYRDSKDMQQLELHRITHILAIHDSPKHLHPDKHYLCVMAADTPGQNLSQYFSVCNDFIHSARLKDCNVLIHCLAGMSRSVTVTVAYVMSITPLDWQDALRVVRVGRNIANPNAGFQTQLREYEAIRLLEERRRMKERYPSQYLTSTDLEYCAIALENYDLLILNKSICNGACKRGENCPTGMCRMDSRGGIRRKPSSVSLCPSTSSRVSQSCPSSPRHSKQMRNSPTSLSQLALPTTSNPINESLTRTMSCNIRRSPSSASTSVDRPKSGPSGLRNYTAANAGSAPSSIAASRVDLTSNGNAVKQSGSVLYLGGAGGSQKNPGISGSRLSLVSKSSLQSPTASPKRRPRQ